MESGTECGSWERRPAYASLGRAGSASLTKLVERAGVAANRMTFPRPRGVARATRLVYNLLALWPSKHDVSSYPEG